MAARPALHGGPASRAPGPDPYQALEPAMLHSMLQLVGLLLVHEGVAAGFVSGTGGLGRQQQVTAAARGLKNHGLTSSTARAAGALIRGVEGDALHGEHGRRAARAGWLDRPNETDWGLNARDFGAVGDGIADDAPALLATAPTLPPAQQALCAVLASVQLYMFIECRGQLWTGRLHQCILGACTRRIDRHLIGQKKSCH